MSAETVPEWLVTPPGGWTADDLDRLPPEAPRCEVLDGALYLMSPQRDFHSCVMLRLGAALESATVSSWRVRMEMSIRIDQHNRPEPDIVVAYPRAHPNPDLTFYQPGEVVLAVEIQSPDSIHRDRVIKPTMYASAGIPNYWLIDDVHGAPTVHVFELDESGRRYTEVAVERRKLEVEQPFPFSLDVNRLYP